MAWYDTELVRSLAQEKGSRHLCQSAIDGCFKLSLSLDDIWDTLSRLDPKECVFIKTLDSRDRPGEKLDVYDALVEGRNVYIKVKITKSTLSRPSTLVVLSFKKNEHYD